MTPLLTTAQASRAWRLCEEAGFQPELMLEEAECWGDLETCRHVYRRLTERLAVETDTSERAYYVLKLDLVLHVAADLQR